MTSAAEVFGPSMRWSTTPVAICGTSSTSPAYDLVGDNLLRDGAGRLWLVDWDGAALAPRERDLAGFAGQGFGRFLDAYERAAGDRGLDLDRTWLPSSCCAATSTTWSTGWVPCCSTTGPTGSVAGTWTGCCGACRAGTRWRRASGTPPAAGTAAATTRGTLMLARARSAEPGAGRCW